MKEREYFVYIAPAASASYPLIKTTCTFSLAYRLSRRRSGGPSVGPTNATLKHLNILTVTPDATTNKLVRLLRTFLSVDFQTHFSLPSHPRIITFNPIFAYCTVQKDLIGSSAVVHILPQRLAPAGPLLRSPSNPSPLPPDQRCPALSRLYVLLSDALFCVTSLL